MWGWDACPCVHRFEVCSFDKINQAVAQAARVGLTHYYAVVQAFADDYHRLPSASELQEQFAWWQQSRMEGYLVFNLDYAGTTLAGHLDLVAQLQRTTAWPTAWQETWPVLRRPAPLSRKMWTKARTTTRMTTSRPGESLSSPKVACCSFGSQTR